MTIGELMNIAIQRQASDLHLVVGMAPYLRVHGELLPMEGAATLTEEMGLELVVSMMTPDQKELFLNNRELDFSFEHEGGVRFRINAYFQQNKACAALRLLNNEVLTIDQLKLPAVCHQLTQLKQGFVLVTGPTGQGKSTTLAAMIEEINRTRAEHIVTIEDPIEYVYKPKMSIISQRELHADTHSWDMALRSALREDPNVVLIGEMRDYDTIAAALTIAETGHLVFATLHTNSAAQSIDRVIDVFPENQQNQVRNQLAMTLEAVLAERLVPSVDKVRIPVMEVMLASSAVRSTVREGKTHQIDNIIQTSMGMGMMSFESSLLYWIKSGQITLDVAREYALRPDELMRAIQK